MTATGKHTPVEAPTETASGTPGVLRQEASHLNSGATTPLREDYFEDVASYLDYAQGSAAPVADSQNGVVPQESAPQPHTPYPYPGGHPPNQSAASYAQAQPSAAYQQAQPAVSPGHRPNPEPQVNANTGPVLPEIAVASHSPHAQYAHPAQGYPPPSSHAPPHGYQPDAQPAPLHGYQPGAQPAPQHRYQPGAQPAPPHGYQPGAQPAPQHGYQLAPPAGQEAWPVYPPPAPPPANVYGGEMPAGAPPGAMPMPPGVAEGYAGYDASAYNMSGRYESYAGQEQTSGDITIPRISIQCFFERPFVQSSLVSVMRDRRMGNVSMEMEVGGLTAAIRHYANNSAPNLIIVESTATGGQLLANLDALASNCDEGVKVVVIGMANDVRLYRELIQRGVSEYLVPPIHPLQMIEVISRLFSDEDNPFVGRTIAVCGARGGCGASTIAHNLAWSCAEHIGIATTLVDLDLSFGTVGLDFNQESMQSVADVLATPDHLDVSVLERMVARASGNLSLLNAPASLDSPYDFGAEAYVQLIEQVRRSVPLVVLDLPHVWTDWFEKVTTAADDIVVVANPDLTSLRNAQKLFKVFKDKRINDSPPHLILNMTGIAKRPEIPMAEFAKVTDVKPAASIGFDARLFGKAANNGQMLAMVDARAQCVTDLDDLASNVIGRRADRKKKSAIVEKVKQFLPG